MYLQHLSRVYTWSALTLMARCIARRHHLYMPFSVSKARKKFGVKYPALYAPEGAAQGKEFNCVQRGAQTHVPLPWLWLCEMMLRVQAHIRPDAKAAAVQLVCDRLLDASCIIVACVVVHMVLDVSIKLARTHVRPRLTCAC